MDINKNKKNNKVIEEVKVSENTIKSKSIEENNLNQVDAIKKDEKKTSKIIQDPIYRVIYNKLKNNEFLNDSEMRYFIIYNECKKNAKDKENFSLINYKRNHASNNISEIREAFHYALKKLSDKEIFLFFNDYNFQTCLRCPGFGHKD